MSDELRRLMNEWADSAPAAEATNWPTAVRATVRARRRRQQLAGAVAAAVLVAGAGTAVLAAQSPEREVLAGPAPTASPSPAATSPASTSPEPSATAEPQPAPSPIPSATAPPAGQPSEQPTATPPAATASALPPPTTYEGTATDAAGRPLAGIQVWALAFNAIDGRPADVTTDRNGRFSLPCGTGRKAILATWRLGQRQDADTRNLAPVFAGGSSSWTDAPALRCGAEVTVLRVGGVIAGTLRQATRDGDADVPDHTSVPDGLGAADALNLQGSILARWDPVGGRYRFVGIPPGEPTLSDGGNGGMNGRYAVAAGQERRLNWTLTCRDCPSRTPSAEPV